MVQDIRLASADELEKFHTKEYIEFLESTAQPPANKAAQKAFERQRMAFNLDDECPVFDGLYRFCQMYSGASLKAARQLNAKAYTIAINWAGGLHHAKHTKASGMQN